MKYKHISLAVRGKDDVGYIFEDMSDITKLLYFCRQKYTPDYVIFIKLFSKQYYSSH